jgi:hypothetical protein
MSRPNAEPTTWEEFDQMLQDEGRKLEYWRRKADEAQVRYDTWRVRNADRLRETIGMRGGL